GYFAAERKRALPSFPRRIGLITSAQGAALHDVLTTFARRAPYLEIVLYPSLVQGAEAPAALVAAIELANRRAEVDVLLLCRGGGSLEDLWAFNDERVVQAIARSALVLVCGVGHETDVTLADLTADLRAATPTAAAELAAPARAVLMTELEHREQALQRRLMARLDSAAQRLDRLALRLQQPARTLHRQLDRLQSLERRSIQALRTSIKTARIGPKDLQARLVRALDSNLERRHLALAARQDKLEALDPRHVLARGYAWMENRDGQAIVSARGLSTGQRVRAVWLDGSAESTLERIVLKPDMAPLARPPENGAH
ncbi:exodeoxyribonuclease VII large subunit, partial [Ideonella sp.]|uniref:exodeoxyribonuclease VII large subunit n=1 Tax=Ideonella sp. TaxID=1929293 RepID=UPI003BB7854C